MKKVEYHIVWLCLLLSLSASACDFTTGMPGTGDHDPAGRGATGSTEIVPLPPIEATPELDSLTLFGTALLAAAAYVRQRRRT